MYNYKQNYGYYPYAYVLRWGNKQTIPDNSVRVTAANERRSGVGNHRLGDKCNNRFAFLDSRGLHKEQPFPSANHIFKAWNGLAFERLECKD